MKKTTQFLFVTLAVMSSTQALATMSRLSVMGTADPYKIAPHGSFYYENRYNHIYNPAFINSASNWMTIETDANSTVGTQHVEGGFATSIMNFNVGVYLNRSDADSMLTPQQGFNSVRPIDITIGADMGARWGLGVTFDSQKTGTSTSKTLLELRAGVLVGDFEPFLHARVIAKDSNGAAVLPKDTSYNGGVRYRFGEWTPFAGFKMDKTVKDAATESTAKAFGFGLARNTRISENTNLNYALSAWRAMTRGTVTPGNSVGNNVTRLPVDISIESHFASWITGRAGLTYELLNRLNGVTATGTTSARLGSTIHASKQTGVDFAFGGGAASGTVGGEYYDFAHGTFAMVGVTHNW